VDVKSIDSPWVKNNIDTYRSELDKLLKFSRPKNYKSGKVVYFQGERSSKFYFLRKGSIKASIFREDGSEKILAVHENNSFFGEAAALDGHPNYATVTVLEPAEVFQIDREDLIKAIRATPSVAFMIFFSLIRKMRLLAFQVEDLSFLDAQKKVIHILLALVHELGVKKVDGFYIEKKITHDDIAHLTGLSRVTVTNILNHLERLKIIEKRRCTLKIIDQEWLTNLLEKGG
jgi:CRP/FNR family transcriptional regulator, cyclic AMP receptor protein